MIIGYLLVGLCNLQPCDFGYQFINGTFYYSSENNAGVYYPVYYENNTIYRPLGFISYSSKQYAVERSGSIAIDTPSSELVFTTNSTDFDDLGADFDSQNYCLLDICAIRLYYHQLAATKVHIAKKNLKVSLLFNDTLRSRTRPSPLV